MKHFFGKEHFLVIVVKIKCGTELNHQYPHKLLNAEFYFLKIKNLFLNDSP
jgi:hypothetical protein